MKDMKTYDNNKNPLVSIIVVTYNSSKYVLETLESAKAQTYQDIELIISDDSSTDHTVEICQQWLNDNKQHFLRTKMITVEKNTGIPANCNRGVKASQGEWLKLIAGDDILLKNAIQDLVIFSDDAASSDFIFADFAYINDEGTALNKNSDINKLFFNLDSSEQNKILVIGSNFMIPALTGFILKKTLLNLGCFDEEIKYCEDYPMWLRATYFGHRLSFLDLKIAKYRIHSESITGHFNKRYHVSMKKVFFKYRVHGLLKFKPFYALELVFYNLFREKEKFNKFSRYLIPSNYIRRVKKYFTK